MIELKQVRKVYNAGKPSEYIALHGIDLLLEPQKVTVLKGPSGSGKTTLLSLLGCMTRPTSGRIHVFGKEITSLPERFLTDVRRKTFGFIFQQFQLIKGITALENVMLPAYPSGEKRSVLKQRAENLLEILNLSHKADAKIQWLSGGEAQRVAIARALINNPAVIVADEPTAHLDTKLAFEFMEVMKRLRRQGMTVIIASHDAAIHQSAIVDRVVALKDGMILSQGQGYDS